MTKYEYERFKSATDCSTDEQIRAWLNSLGDDGWQLIRLDWNVMDYPDRDKVVHLAVGMRERR